MTTYTAKDITVLEGLDPVRKRPGMYIGGVTSAGLHHLIWEILDNAIDEAMNGYASAIVLTLHKEGTSVTVASQAAHALRKSLDLPANAFTYLTSHGDLDQSHIKYFESLIERLEHAADRAAVGHCGRMFYKLYGDIFRDLDAKRAAIVKKEAA